MKSTQSTVFSYSQGDVNLSFTLLGDEQKKDFLEILKQAAIDVESSIDQKKS